MKDRLDNFLKSEGLTSVKFAEIMQVQPSSISHLLSGRNNPNFEFISKMLSRFPDLNPDWLISGKGAMYRLGKTSNNDNVTNVTNRNQTNVNADVIEEYSFDNIDNKRKNNSFTNVNNKDLLNINLLVDTKPNIDNVTLPNQLPNNQYLDQDIIDNRIIIDNVNPHKNDAPNKLSEKRISKVVIFYSDGTCSAYSPE